MPAVSTTTNARPAAFFATRFRAARTHEARCTSCNVRTHCLAAGVPPEDLEQVQNVVSARRRVKRGETLFRAGDEFTSVYAVRWGTFKTSAVHDDGREQVTAFVMGGELLGIGGLASGRHSSTAVALEDAEVCVMPYRLIESMGRDYVALQRHLHAALSGEIVRARSMMMLLGSMRAEERLAAFLCNLSERFLRRGHSPREFHLRMSRSDVASYLGVKIETVCRLFTRFRAEGLIALDRRHVRIVDIAAVRRIAGAA